jgi:GGDEF domain-containing protein
MERLQELQRITNDGYAAAISAAAQYAVETDPEQAQEFRQHLQALAKLLQSPGTPEELQTIKVSLRGEFRDYQHVVHARLARLHQDVKAAAAAMQNFAEGMVSGGADHEKQLDEELQRLEIVAKSDDLGKIRGGIRAATGNIASSVERLRRGNQLIIAQLQDEIRILHQEVQAERRAQYTDRASGAWNRQKITERVEELFRQNEPFCFLVVRIHNLKQLDGKYSRNVIEGTLKAFLMRFHQILGEDAMIGRWSTEEFVGILEITPPEVVAVSSEIARKLSGNYSVQENGLSQTVGLQIMTGIIERREGVISDSFYRKVEQLGDTLAQA